jgi:DeoD family purine-nucleoside phosphorylase
VIHIHPTAPLAERVLLPGDPGRALRLAQDLIDTPKMFNHNRGLWGYTGPAKADGAPLSIQSTGMGGPSTAIVVSELIALGARRLIRIGTCGALNPALGLGQLVIAAETICDDGTSRALAGAERLAGDAGLLTALRDAAARLGEAPADGPVVSTDLFYDAEQRRAAWPPGAAQAVEMEAATLFALAARREVAAGCLLLVTGTAGSDPARIDDEETLFAGELRLGRAAAAALAGG